MPEADTEADVVQFRQTLLESLSAWNPTGPVVTGAIQQSLPLPLLRVTSIGLIPLPVQPLLSESLIKKASVVRGPSSNVRCIDAEHLSVTKHWHASIQELAQQHSNTLGVKPHGKAVATLKRLVVLNVDSYLNPPFRTFDAGVYANMLVQLPTDHVGGHLHVSHSSTKYEFPLDERASDAFYAVSFLLGCNCEFKPVTSGLKVLLDYDLHIDTGPKFDIVTHLSQKVAFGHANDRVPKLADQWASFITAEHARSNLHQIERPPFTSAAQMTTYLPYLKRSKQLDGSLPANLLEKWLGQEAKLLKTRIPEILALPLDNDYSSDLSLPTLRGQDKVWAEQVNKTGKYALFLVRMTKYRSGIAKHIVQVKNNRTGHEDIQDLVQHTLSDNPNDYKMSKMNQDEFCTEWLDSNVEGNTEALNTCLGKRMPLIPSDFLSYEFEDAAPSEEEKCDKDTAKNAEMDPENYWDDNWSEDLDDCEDVEQEGKTTNESSDVFKQLFPQDPCSKSVALKDLDLPDCFAGCSYFDVTAILRLKYFYRRFAFVLCPKNEMIPNVLWKAGVSAISKYQHTVGFSQENFRKIVQALERYGFESKDIISVYGLLRVAVSKRLEDEMRRLLAILASPRRTSTSARRNNHFHTSALEASWIATMHELIFQYGDRKELIDLVASVVKREASEHIHLVTKWINNLENPKRAKQQEAGNIEKTDVKRDRELFSTGCDNHEQNPAKKPKMEPVLTSCQGTANGEPTKQPSATDIINGNRNIKSVDLESISKQLCLVVFDTYSLSSRMALNIFMNLDTFDCLSKAVWTQLREGSAHESEKGCVDETDKSSLKMGSSVIHFIKGICEQGIETLLQFLCNGLQFCKLGIMKSVLNVVKTANFKPRRTPGNSPSFQSTLQNKETANVRITSFIATFSWEIISSYLLDCINSTNAYQWAALSEVMVTNSPGSVEITAKTIQCMQLDCCSIAVANLAFRHHNDQRPTNEFFEWCQKLDSHKPTSDVSKTPILLERRKPKASSLLDVALKCSSTYGASRTLELMLDVETNGGNWMEEDVDITMEESMQMITLVIGNLGWTHTKDALCKVIAHQLDYCPLATKLSPSETNGSMLPVTKTSRYDYFSACLKLVDILSLSQAEGDNPLDQPPAAVDIFTVVIWAFIHSRWIFDMQSKSSEEFLCTELCRYLEVLFQRVDKSMVSHLIAICFNSSSIHHHYQALLKSILVNVNITSQLPYKLAAHLVANRIVVLRKEVSRDADRFCLNKYPSVRIVHMEKVFTDVDTIVEFFNSPFETKEFKVAFYTNKEFHGLPGARKAANFLNKNLYQCAQVRPGGSGKNAYIVIKKFDLAQKMFKEDQAEIYRLGLLLAQHGDSLQNGTK